MQTEVLSEPRIAAWLEFTPPSGSVSETIPLEAEAFIMGRSETADLPIDSNRVSREHAVIERRGEGWRVRDLRSTNGTFVNGTRVEESPLRDGDALVIADVEYIFRMEQESAPTVSFTQVMGDEVKIG
ncbi:MAG: FHA domain-containing protein, partial [Planctomycetes bacterium]|nr:FHA domain-containing protein [Planctomycetota bacterium]